MAQIEVSNLVGNTVDGVLARLTGRRPLAPFALVREAATVAAAAPLAIPLLAAAGIMRLANRMAPPLPVVEMPPPDEANLLAHVLATATPTYLANATARLVVLGLPGRFAVGVRSGRTSATVRFGGRALVVENGISPDALVVIEGEIEPLFELATGSIVRELSAARPRGH